MHHYHIVRFQRRTVIEMLGREETLTQQERLVKHRELEEILPLAEGEVRRLANVRSPAIAGAPLDSQYEHNRWAGWYGIEADEPVPVSGCTRRGDWTIIRIGAHGYCRVRTDDITVEGYDSFRAKSNRPLFVPVPLADGPVAAELLDPVRSFFRPPDEDGFWERITSDWCDSTARLVYADWLDEHGDPYGWVFREPTPVAHGYQWFDWVGAARQVGSHVIGRQRTLWEFAGVTRRDRGVWFELADATPVPQVVAYLLAVSRIRAEERLSDADLKRLCEVVDRVEVNDEPPNFIRGGHCLRRLGNTQLWLEGDLLVGPDNEPVCGLTDSARLALQIEQPPQANPPTPADLVARLRAASGDTAVTQATRVGYPFLPGVPGPVLHPGTDLDPLTGVGNRRAFDTVLAEVLLHRTRRTFPLSALSLDVDHFAVINHTYSHTVGDRTLVEFARLVWATLGDRGFVARTTGDGFTVLLPHFGAGAAFEVGEELRRAVERWRGAGDWGGGITLTVSIGVAEYAPDQPHYLRDVAEDAVRRAKAAGRNRVSF